MRLLDADSPVPSNSASIVVGDITLYLPLEDMLDIEAECERLTNESARLQSQLDKTRGMLDNDNFVNKARPDVVQRERDRLVELEAAHAQVAERLSNLCS